MLATANVQRREVLVTDGKAVGRASSNNNETPKKSDSTENSG